MSSLTDLLRRLDDRLVARHPDWGWDTPVGLVLIALALPLLGMVLYEQIELLRAGDGQLSTVVLFGIGFLSTFVGLMHLSWIRRRERRRTGD